MGISLSDFDRLTPSQLGEAFKAHGRASEMSEREKWDRMRVLGAALLSPYCGKGRGPLDPKKAFPMPWDAEERQPIASREESHNRYKKLISNGQIDSHPQN